MDTCPSKVRLILFVKNWNEFFFSWFYQRMNNQKKFGRFFGFWHPNFNGQCGQNLQINFKKKVFSSGFTSRFCSRGRFLLFFFLKNFRACHTIPARVTQAHILSNYSLKRVVLKDNKMKAPGRRCPPMGGGANVNPGFHWNFYTTGYIASWCILTEYISIPLLKDHCLWINLKPAG